ncbi:hypothetical protein [Niallia sp. 03190]|uniref:hypothetical protein n=1 Tax=Niallia sp. 03190 TaxID=3458061 RepID=UPI004044C964
MNVFNGPKKQYDDKMAAMDEQLCALIKQRIDYTEKSYLVPPPKNIVDWAEKYELSEEMLQTIFSDFEVDRYKPSVEPEKFRKNIPVLKSVKINKYIYTVIFIRQYANASVLHMTIDWDSTSDQSDHEYPPHLKLYIGEEFRCRKSGGGGTQGHTTQDFIISPPLPDDISGLSFYFYQDVDKEDQENRTEFDICID